MADSVHWPVFNKYWGCLRLEYGIYAVAISKIGLLSVLVGLDVRVILHALYQCASMQQPPGLQPWLQTLPPPAPAPAPAAHRTACTNEQMLAMYHLIIINHLLWIILEAVSLVSSLMLLWGVFKKRTLLMKIYIDVNAPLWVLAIVYAALNVYLLSKHVKIIVLLVGCITGYQILAVRSHYRVVTGKTKFYKETNVNITRDSTNSALGFSNMHVRQPLGRHCPTCLRNLTCLLPDSPTQQSNGLDSQVAQLYTNSLSDISWQNLGINNQATNSSVTTRNVPTIGLLEPPANTRHPEIANNIQENNEKNIMINCDVEESPVIFDEGQLNVGGSRVIEDRPHFDP